MKRNLTQILIVILLSMFLMAFVSMDENKQPKPNPYWNIEINSGEPGMEKVAFYYSINVVSERSQNQSPTKSINVKNYFSWGGGNYGWYFVTVSSSRVPVVGLCRWHYIYDGNLGL